MPDQKNVNRACLLLGLLFFCSYIYPHHYHPFRAFYHDMLAFIAVTLSLGCLVLSKPPAALMPVSESPVGGVPGILAFLRRPFPLPLPVTVLLPLFVALVIALQTWNDMVLLPIDSLFPIIYMLGFAVAMVLGAGLASAEKGLEKLCLTMACMFIASGVVSILCQQVQLLGLNGSPWVFPLTDRLILRPYGNLGQPNLLASLLCFGLASLWWMTLAGKMRARPAFVLAVVFLWGLTLTQSRIGWVLMPLFSLFSWWSFGAENRISRKILILLLFIYASMVAFTPLLLELTGVTVPGLSDRISQTSFRLIYWQQAWFMSTLHPWLGAGWFKFGPQEIMYASLFRITQYSENAHNIILNLAVEIGWPATLLIVLASVVWFYRRCVRFWRHLQLGLPIRFVTLLFFTIAVHSLVEFPLWFALMLLPFGVMIGAMDFTGVQLDKMLHVDDQPESQQPETQSALVPPASVPSDLLLKPVLRSGLQLPEVIRCSRALIMLFCLASLVIMAGMSWDYRRVMIGFAVLEQEQRGVHSAEFNTDRPAFTLYSQFFDYFYITRIKVGPGMSAQDIAYLEKMSVRFGYPPILERMAMTYAYNQRPTEARQVMLTIERLHNIAYTGIFVRWQEFARLDPVHFAEIVKRLPLPTWVDPTAILKKTR